MEEKDTTRLNFFSDAVFAIAITLLILEIKAPEVETLADPEALWRSLEKLWPSYLAFIASFASVLIMWINHHGTSLMLVKTSRPFIYANGFLLLTVTFYPFPTAVIARYLTTEFITTAAVFYCGFNLIVNIAFNLLWETIHGPGGLLKPDVDPKIIRRITLAVRSGFFLNLITTVVSFWSPVVGLIINSSIWILWGTMSYKMNKE